MRRTKKLSRLGVLWLLLLPVPAKGDVAAMPAHIEVSHRYITVLVFDSPVCEVDLASDAYVAKLSGNYLLLRCRRASALPTSLFVTYAEGKSFLHTLIRYAPDPPKTYDLRDYAPSAKEAKEQAVTAQLLQRVGHLSALPQAYKDLGLRVDGLTLVLMNVMTDKGHLYLRLSLKNDSGMDYTIEGQRFCFQSGPKKAIEVSPVFAEESCIASGQRAPLLYVLPRYGVKVKGSLEIALREASGERILQFSIPGSVLLKAHRHNEQLSVISDQLVVISDRIAINKSLNQ